MTMPAITRSAKIRKSAHTTRDVRQLPYVKGKISSLQSERLCIVCQTFEQEAICYQSYWLNGETFNHYATFAELEDSARLGCQLCKLLRKGYVSAQLGYGGIKSKRESLRYLLESDTLISEHYTCPLRDETSYHTLKLSMQTYQSKEDTTGKNFTGCWSISLSRLVDCDECEDLPERWEQTAGFALLTDICNAAYIDGRLGGRILRDYPDLHLAKAWLKCCLDSHSCISLAPKTHPTRLVQISVKSSNRSEKYTWRIINTRGNEQYAALSYRWSPTMICSTLNENLRIRRQSLPIELLPVTLQESIFIAYSLGLSFIWIDCLCIIQHDISDWDNECPKMAGIYAGARFTIATDNAKHADTPLLSRLSLYLDRAVCPLQYYNAQGIVAGEVYLRAYQTLEHCVSIVEPPKLPILEKRGWTLQERTLSPRVLHFGDHMMWWECSTAYRCEVARTPISTAKFHLPILMTVKGPSDTTSAAKLFQWWRGLIEMYSGRDLSILSDRLPAVSGIAVCVQSYTKSQYLAGLWRDDWIMSIIWRTDTDTLKDPHEEEAPASRWTRCQSHQLQYRAPSWSWAAAKMEGHCITYPDNAEEVKLDAIAHLERAEVNTSGHNAFGNVLEGTSLTIKALVCSAWLERLEHQSPHGLWHKYEIRSSQTGYQRRRQTKVSVDNPCLIDGRCRQIRSTHHTLCHDKILPIVLLYLCNTTTRNDAGNRITRSVYSLILEPVSKYEVFMVYRRIGLVEEWSILDGHTGKLFEGQEANMSEFLFRQGEVQTVKLI